MKNRSKTDTSCERGTRFVPPKNPTNPRPLNFVGFDTETEGDDAEFLCGAFEGMYTTRKGKEVRISKRCGTLEEFHREFEKIETQFNRIRRRPTFIGYNTSYDLVYLEPYIDTATRRDGGSRFLWAKSKEGNTFYDLLNHVRGTLNSWIERLNMEETHGVRARDGYLDSRAGKWAQVQDDARATYLLANWVQDRYNNHFGVPFKPTQFGCALDLFRRHHFTGSWMRRPRDMWKHRVERSGYYGGRVEVFKRGTHNVSSYDINGMYVDIMKNHSIPNPTTTRTIHGQDNVVDLIEAGEHLLVDCEVSVPYMHVGPLPYRDPTLNKLIFPVGSWRATYHSHEILNAITYGAEIERVHLALLYPESAKSFESYAQMVIEGRKRAREEGDKNLDQLYKNMGNGLYGKFAQRNGGDKQYIRIEDYKGEVTGIPIEEDYEGRLWVTPPATEATPAYHSFPCVSATITTEARIKLFKALEANETSVVYCDTDCIKTVGHPVGIDIGDASGQFGYEYTAEQTFYGPKIYGDTDEDRKRKGVHRTAELLRKTKDEETYRFKNPVGYREGKIRDIPQNRWLVREKTISLSDNKRVWFKDGESEPYTLLKGKIIHP